MVNIIISGFILGLTLAVLVGPAFFTLLQTSITHGFRIGMYLAIGIFLSDFTLVSLSFLGASQVISGPKYRIAFGIIGGIILIVYGLYTFLKKVKVFAENGAKSKHDLQAKEEKIIQKIHAPQPVLYIIKGYFLNLINPFLLIFWVGIMSFVTAEYNDSPNKNFDVFIFFGTALTTVLATDFLKCFVANQIKRFLNQKILVYINHGLGILLIGTGVYLVIKTIVVFYLYK
jgi:threonine/homoserine/homoserine lactone efflux protein